MNNSTRYHGLDLTRHVARPRILGGRPVVDWLKFYGLVCGLWLTLTYTYTRHLELFEDIMEQPKEYQTFVMLFAGLPVLITLPAIIYFLWWAAGALTRFSIWQEHSPRLWRWFWFAVLVFYGIVLLDPTDKIHPNMSVKGLAPAPNLLKLYDGQLEFFTFQWGYFLLWFLFWFLVVAVSFSHIMGTLRIVWFYVRRFFRYGASILTGFRETQRMAFVEASTIDYPQVCPARPEAFRGAPRLNRERLTESEARAVITADASGAIAAVPGQPTVLFVDLGVYYYSPGLSRLRGEDGEPLLVFDTEPPGPAAGRDGLVVPLKRGGQPAGGGA